MKPDNKLYTSKMKCLNSNKVTLLKERKHEKEKGQEAKDN
jgi:hypothetical protein